MNALLEQLQFNIQTIFPFLVTTILVGLSVGSRLTRFTDMALENLGLSFAMNWIYDNLTWHSQDLSVPGEGELRVSSKVRSRDAKDHSSKNHDDPIGEFDYFP